MQAKFEGRKPILHLLGPSVIYLSPYKSDSIYK
jgi:hypothetical protein